MMDGLFLFDTAISPVLGGSSHLGTLVGDNGGINAEGRRQEFEYGKESDTGDASNEAGYSEKDVQCLQQLAWRVDRRIETNQGLPQSALASFVQTI